MSGVREEIVRPAAADALDKWAHRRMYYAAAAIAFGTLVLLGYVWWAHVQDERHAAALEAQIATLAKSAAANNSAAQQLASQVRSLGATPTVQPQPAPAVGPAGAAGQPGAAGASGATGAAGRGILSTQLVGSHLLLSYTDGQTVDVGVVAQPGAPGPQGRGITSTSINAAGHLLVVYSDGQVLDAGTVAGPRGEAGASGANGATGRGVTSVTINSASHVIVSYTDGTTADAGVAPPGPPGPTGPSGPAGASGARGSPPAGWTWTDVAGRQQSCSRDGGTDTSPHYACTASPPTISVGR